MSTQTYRLLLVTIERLTTRSLLRRKGMDLPSFNCVLCRQQAEETQFHLFLNCPFALNCWSILNLQINSTDPIQVLEGFINQLSVPFALDIIIILAWCIWMTRNDLIFKGVAATLNSVRARCKSEFALVILRAKGPTQIAMSLWLEALM